RRLLGFVDRDQDRPLRPFSDTILCHPRPWNVQPSQHLATHRVTVGKPGGASWLVGWPAYPYGFELPVLHQAEQLAALAGDVVCPSLQELPPLLKKIGSPISPLDLAADDVT